MSLEASQFFFKLLSALLVSHTGASVDRFQYMIRAGIGWVSLASLPCLYASVNMLFGPRAVCLVYKPVARLQTGQVCNRFATYICKHE